MRVTGNLFPGRLNASLELFASLVTLAFFGVLVWQFIELSANYTAAGRTTRTIHIPLGPFWWITTAIMAICVPVQLYVVWSWLKACITGASPRFDQLSSTDMEHG